MRGQDKWYQLWRDSEALTGFYRAQAALTEAIGHLALNVAEADEDTTIRPEVINEILPLIEEARALHKKASAVLKDRPEE